MHKKIMMWWGFFIILFFNYNIYKKEQIKKSKDIVLLELAPVDPRSLMQGDYMRLNYAITNDSKIKLNLKSRKDGKIVIAPDKNNVAQFIKIYEGEQLKAGEKLLSYYRNYHRIKIVPNSFMFQEGHGKFYDKAKYAIFKFNSDGKYLLTGLADKDGKEIIPTDNSK